MDFDDATPPKDPAQPPKNTDNPLELLVGEGKPFKTEADLAKGKLEADTFIEQLKAENANMRAKLGEAEQASLKGATMAEILEAVRKSTTGSPNDPPDPSGEEPKDGNQSRLSEDDVAQLVQRTLEKNQTAHKQKANYDKVREAFQSRYSDPDKARLQYKSVAAELGMSEAQLDEFAKTSPSIVLRAAGLEGAKPSEPPSYLSNNQNSEAGPGGGQEQAKDNSWWESQRKAKGNKWYFQPKVQQAYWKDVNALGDSFFKD